MMTHMSGPRRFDDYLNQRELGINVAKTYKFQNFTSPKQYVCQKDVREHRSCVNAVIFSHNERLVASGGDDLYARVWVVDEMMMRRAPKPIIKMAAGHESNIFGLQFDIEDRYLYSGSGLGTLIKHNIETGQSIWSSTQRRGEICNLNQNPKDNNLLAVTRAHQVSFIDDRDRPNPTIFRPEIHAKYYNAEFHPQTPRIFLVSTRSRGPDVYDLRRPDHPIIKPYDFAGAPTVKSYEWQTSRWSPSGDQFMTIRSVEWPVYFDMISKRAFALRSTEYWNNKTIKSLAFIDDQTVCTGNDRWGIHVWKVPHPTDSKGFDRPSFECQSYSVPREANILEGHRSVPNQIDYSPTNQLLISSGVEASIKLWSNVRLPWSYDVPFPRRSRGRYTHSRADELEYEREERREVEEALDRQGLMEGRASWDDVFGGSAETAENRRTLEHFDLTGRSELTGAYVDVDDVPMRLRNTVVDEGLANRLQAQPVFVLVPSADGPPRWRLEMRVDAEQEMDPRVEMNVVNGVMHQSDEEEEEQQREMTPVTSEQPTDTDSPLISPSSPSSDGEHDSDTSDADIANVEARVAEAMRVLSGGLGDRNDDDDDADADDEMGEADDEMGDADDSDDDRNDDRHMALTDPIRFLTD